MMLYLPAGIPAGMTTLVAYVKAKPGKEAELKQVLLGLVGPTRKEAGCIDYHLHVSDDDPRTFLFYENWRTRKDLDEHLEMPYLKAFIARHPELLDGDIPLHFYTMLSERPR